jgi:hypothetical protein
MDPKKTPRVPKEIRRRAYSVLRHFPSDWDMQRAAKAAPEVFQERMEPVTRMFMVYREEQKENNG